MKIKALINELQRHDPEREVILSSDSEGNRHSPLAEIFTAAYLPENSLSGDVGLEKLTAADRKAGYSSEDVITDGVPALILVPAN